MRKLLSPVLVTLIALCFFTVGCNQAEVAKLKSENESLKSEVDELSFISEQKDSTFNDLFKDLNDIERNLQEIKQREKGLVKKKIGKGDISGSVKDRIIDDIKIINELLVANREKINSLNAKLKRANINTGEFEKMVTALEAQLAQKNEEITSLRENLANANDALSALNDLYIESVMEAEARQEELNRGYYAFGTFKELKENNVLSKEGGLIGMGAAKTLKDDFNKGYFKEVDISQTESIKLYSPKAKIVTQHPSESYKLELVDGNYVLKINNETSFWSVSKYLVIITD